MTFIPGGSINASDYNNLLSAYNKLFGTGVGDFGYGGNSVAENPIGTTIDVPITDLPQVVKGNKIDNEEWLNLRNAIASVAYHQGVNLVNPLPNQADIEDMDPVSFFASIDSSINMDLLINNRHNVNPSFVSTLSTMLTDERTTTWNNFVTHEFTVDFGSADVARNFFNRSGTIQISASRTGGSASLKNDAWTNLLANNSPIEFARDDYNSLTGTYQNVVPPFTPSMGPYSYGSTGAYAFSYAVQTTWTILARRDDESGPNDGNGSIIRFQINFLDGNASAPDVVDGTLRTNIVEKQYKDVFNLPSPIYTTVGNGLNAGT